MGGLAQRSNGILENRIAGYRERETILSSSKVRLGRMASCFPKRGELPHRGICRRRRDSRYGMAEPSCSMDGVGDRHDRSGSGGGVVQYRSGACVGRLASRTGAIRSFGQGLRCGLGDGVERVFGDCFFIDAGRGVGMKGALPCQSLLSPCVGSHLPCHKRGESTLNEMTALKR